MQLRFLLPGLYDGTKQLLSVLSTPLLNLRLSSSLIEEHRLKVLRSQGCRNQLKAQRRSCYIDSGMRRWR